MLNVYIGWDPRDDLTFRACVSSLRAHSSIPLNIYALKEYDLRRRGLYWRSYIVEPNGQMVDTREWRPFSTQFGFTRFTVPLIAPRGQWSLFCDADMLWRRDVAELIGAAQDDKSLMCVKHDHRPPESVKMDGMAQAYYHRKNWSSLMLLRPERCPMTAQTVNTASGLFLHGLAWLPDDAIGGLPQEWNWLEGWSDTHIDPAVVHYTRGTPDMLGMELPFANEWRAAGNAWTPDMNHHELGPNN